MRQCKDDGVEDGGQFGTARRELRPQGCDEVTVAKRTNDDHCGVRAPDGYPQKHICHGHFGNLQLCTLLSLRAGWRRRTSITRQEKDVIYCVTYCISLAQAVHVHFLCLFLESSLVLDYSHHNLAVEENTDGDWDNIVEDVGVEDKTLGVPILCQVIVAAREQLSFCSELTSIYVDSS